MCWTACRSVWCGKCYTPHPLDKFYRYVVEDEDGFDWRPPMEQTRHCYARDGDHLITPFQCDICMFRNLQMRNPDPLNSKDTLLLCCIRRANLDALWGRESLTVQATLRAARQMITQWRLVGLRPEFPALGPFPVGDWFGVRVAVAMLLKSLEPGRYHESYQQFETIRKLRAGYSNIYMASQDGVNSLRTVGSDKAKYTLTSSPTQSLWFERFAQGCLRRMGQDVRQDWAITIEAMGALMDVLEKEWGTATLWAEKDKIASAGAYSVVAFCGSFRGNEVFLVDLLGLRRYLRELNKEKYVIVPLLGRFKGEAHTRYHLAPMAAETNSGLQVKVWLLRLVEVREAAYQLQGPAFQTKDGNILSSQEMEGAIAERLQIVKHTRPGVIPAEIDCYENFGISRSFRRGATSAARARGVMDRQVELVNRWRKFEGAKGRRPVLPMHEHYSDIQVLIPEMIKFSQAL